MIYNQADMMQSISLYLHIPFCQHRCSYCDFNTYVSVGHLKEAYAEALADEVKQVGEQALRLYGAPLHVKTIFFGGGTPSLMSPESLALILQAVRSHFVLSETAEISLEANPGTVTGAYLASLRALGINRLSFGVQSVVPSELALLERDHDFAVVVQAVEMARMAQFDNFNLDLIYGVPNQTLASWQESVQTLLSLDPTHLSLYCLTIEPGTRMERWLHNGRFSAPDPDLAADQYVYACETLAQHGYEHYEISNWSKPNQPCQHNLTYWRNEDYLGLGAGAHGHAKQMRYHIVKQPRVYIRRMQSAEELVYPLSSAVADAQAVTAQDGMTDMVITQLRLLQEGLDLQGFAQKFGISLREAFPNVVEQLEEWELLEENNGRLLLTENGRFLSNQVFHRFF